MRISDRVIFRRYLMVEVIKLVKIRGKIILGPDVVNVCPNSIQSGCEDYTFCEGMRSIYLAAEDEYEQSGLNTCFDAARHVATFSEQFQT